MSRPLLDIDPEKVALLARIGCTFEEIAAEFECSVDTIRDRFSRLIEENQKRFKISIRRQQFRLMANGNAAIAIWLGKQYLNQRDKIDHTGEVTNRVVQVELPRKVPIDVTPKPSLLEVP